MLPRHSPGIEIHDATTSQPTSPYLTGYQRHRRHVTRSCCGLQRDGQRHLHRVDRCPSSCPSQDNVGLQGVVWGRAVEDRRDHLGAFRPGFLGVFARFVETRGNP